MIEFPHVLVTQVTKSYSVGEGTLEALRGVSLQIRKAEFLALRGTSGSGKTTLLNIIGALDSPTQGRIYIAGRNITHLTDVELSHFRSAHLGFVFQTFNLLPVLSGVENVEYPLLKLELSKSERRDRAMDALDRVGLARFAGHRPDQLSGGQRQRVAIARAFVHRPTLILCDEPTANLDKRTATDVLDCLGELNKTLGLTILVATHDPLVVERASRSILLNDGEVEEPNKISNVIPLPRVEKYKW